MTPERAAQIQALKTEAYVKRGAARLALESGDDQQAVSLHMQAVAMERTADEMAVSEKADGE